MPPSLPSFLRRRLRLHEARRALLAGDAEDALARLADPCLTRDEDAARLRERVLDALCREAAHATGNGARDEAARLLELTAREDPERARSWRRRLDGETDRALSDEEGASRGAVRAAMGDLLAEMRERGAATRGRAARRASSKDTPRRMVPGTPSAERPLRFHLAVDDAGEYLALGGDEIVVGHRSDPRSDLPLLADLDAMHARILRTESFHGGPAWHIQPARERRVVVDGREAPERGAALHHGALVELSPGVRFRFRVPDPGSSSVLIELLHGLESEGATRVLLFARGPAGRVRAGRRPDRHLVLREDDRDLALELVGDELRVTSTSGLRRSGANGAVPEIGVSLPPSASLHVTVGERVTGRPPFGFTLRAVEPPDLPGEDGA